MTDEALVELAKQAVTDEQGSRLCAWVALGTTRVCTKDQGRGFCNCEDLARAVLAAVAGPIRAATLEEAAKVCDARCAALHAEAKALPRYDEGGMIACYAEADEASECASAIRALAAS